jgi:aspartate/methionine/tyrosine aminotransferase
MPSFSRTAFAVPGSGIRRIHEIALRMPDVLALAVGEPDQPVAPHVLEAASRAWLADDTDYTANAGIAPLREAIAAKLRRGNGLPVDADQVWVTPGATEALYLALSLVLEPGDEVLIPDPGYTTFTMAPRMLSAVPVPYRLDPDRAFLPDVAGLESQVTARTRAIIVNSPSNPLGVVFPERVLRELVSFAAAHDLWLISDEVYEAFTWGVPHVSPAAFDEDDRVLTVHSFSKTYALTGARVGSLVVPPGLDAVLRTYQEAIVSCVNTPAQHGALAAITGPQDAVGAAAAHYRDNLAAAPTGRRVLPVDRRVARQRRRRRPLGGAVPARAAGLGRAGQRVRCGGRGLDPGVCGGVEGDAARRPRPSSAHVRVRGGLTEELLRPGARVRRAEPRRLPQPGGVARRRWRSSGCPRSRRPAAQVRGSR